MTRTANRRLLMPSRANIIRIVLPYINQVVIIVCNVYNQPYYKGWYALGVVYRDLPQHHHNLMDEVPGNVSAQVRYVTVHARSLSCSVSPDRVLPSSFTVVNQLRRRSPLPKQKFCFLLCARKHVNAKGLECSGAFVHRN